MTASVLPLGQALHSLVQRDRGIGNIKGQSLAVSIGKRGPGGACDLLRQHRPQAAGCVARAGYPKALRNRIVQHVPAGKVLLLRPIRPRR